MTQFEYEMEHGLGVGGGRGRPKGSRNGYISPGAAYMKNYKIRGERAEGIDVPGAQMPQVPRMTPQPAQPKNQNPKPSVPRNTAIAQAEKDEFGRFGRGTIDLLDRKVYIQPDGSISTENSFSFYDDEIGKEVLIPSIINGRQVSDNDAIDYYYATKRIDGVGKHLGTFDTPEEATDYAERLHERQDRVYAQPLGSLQDRMNQQYPQPEEPRSIHHNLPQQEGFNLGNSLLDAGKSIIGHRIPLNALDRATEMVKDPVTDAIQNTGEAVQRFDPIGDLTKIVNGILHPGPEEPDMLLSEEATTAAIEGMMNASAESAAEHGLLFLSNIIPDEKYAKPNGSTRKRNITGVGEVGQKGALVEGKSANYLNENESERKPGIGDYLLQLLNHRIPTTPIVRAAEDVGDYMRRSDYYEDRPKVNLLTSPVTDMDLSPTVFTAANKIIENRENRNRKRPRPDTYRSDTRTSDKHYIRR